MQLVAISPKAASFLRSTAERARVSFAERARVFVHENRSFFFHFFLFFFFFFRPDRGVALLWESERNLRSRRRYAYRRFRRLVENSSPRTVPFRLASNVRIINSTLANVYRQP